MVKNPASPDPPQHARVNITKHAVVTLRARRRRLASSAEDRRLSTPPPLAGRGHPRSRKNPPRPEPGRPKGLTIMKSKP